MRVIMDGQTIAEDAPGFAEGVELARQKAHETGRLVIEVLADGRPADDLLDQSHEAAAAVAPEAITELGITTADKGLFLRETLMNARDALAATRADQKLAGERIDAGQVAPALAALREIVTGWQAVRSVVDQTAALAGVPIESLRVGDATGEAVIGALATDLSQVRDSVAREDWSLLSETLAFDLDARAAEWSGLIDALLARTPGASPA